MIAGYVRNAQAMPKAVQNAGLEMSDVQYWEINEAFSVVALANNQVSCLCSPFTLISRLTHGCTRQDRS